MVKVTVVVRETGRLKPDYSLDFDLPAVPQAGQYISIFRPDRPHHSEDVIVRQVWWQLAHPETGTVTDNPKVGAMRDLMVECDIAEGPYASDAWLKAIEGARSRGMNVETFEVSRYSISEREMAAISAGSPDDDD